MLFAGVFPGEHGWRSGENTRLSPMWPGFDSWTRVICGLSLLLALVLAPRGFSPSTPVFPSPQKPTLLNFNSIWRVSPYCKGKAHLIISSRNYVFYRFTRYILEICDSQNLAKLGLGRKPSLLVLLHQMRRLKDF